MGKVSILSISNLAYSYRQRRLGTSQIADAQVEAAEINIYVTTPIGASGEAFPMSTMQPGNRSSIVFDDPNKRGSITYN
jgi:hypothetical protein